MKKVLAVLVLAIVLSSCTILDAVMVSDMYEGVVLKDIKTAYLDTCDPSFTLRVGSIVYLPYCTSPRIWAWHNDRIESVTITPEHRQFISFLACPEWSSP